ncbi:hypothetical protein FACS189431_4890 [Alphaproteobacteria bacterium]|nr:hypothetical protein FACS189431_4890 [Alphaproteobacteria bacterium]
MKNTNIQKVALALSIVLTGLLGAISLPTVASADTDVIVQLQVNGVVNAPTIDSVSPAEVSTEGGETVTILGHNFFGITGVMVGGKACTPYNVVSDTVITCVAPANAIGLYGVVISSSNGDASKADAVSYVEKDITPAPSLPLPPLAGLFAFFGPDGTLSGYDVIIALAVLLVLGGVIFFICAERDKKAKTGKKTASKRKKTPAKKRR